jgi:hypothetical protein
MGIDAQTDKQLSFEAVSPSGPKGQKEWKKK